ncbi:MAG: hypothetical protein ABIJ45_00990 [Candidatus Zixiibacteriota bacterium]
MRTMTMIITAIAILVMMSPLLGSNDNSDMQKNIEKTTDSINAFDKETSLFSRYPALSKVPIMRGRAIPCTTSIIIETMPIDKSTPKPKQMG